MLKEARRLYEQGWAIHWLYPESKRPIETGWTKGARKNWNTLERSYRSGMNVGVRLGAPSAVDGGFLGVIDVDVKSADKKHEQQATNALMGLMLGVGDNGLPISIGQAVAKTVWVKTGRGNGSAHFYIRTKTPVSPKRLAQSADVVKVKMPSARKASANEQRQLSEKELAEGWRLRPAWEISLMGEGQQVVLPPSIHPDTAKRYEWGTPPGETDLAFLQVESTKKEEVSGAKRQDFEAVEVDLVGSALDDRIVDLILSGKDCEDRSAGLFSATIAMVKAGFKDNEILSVLTDNETFLGEAAFDHAQTESRAKAAAWVEKYTLKKARHETEAQYQFDVEVEETVLSDDQALAQEAEVLERDWRLKIERTDPRTGGKPKSTVANVKLILQNEVAPELFRHNEFAGSDIYGCRAPWGGEKGREVRDIDIINIKFWLAERFRFEPSSDKINEAITQIASENKFHPVRDYLDSLEWDGVSRIDTWMRDYLGAEAPEPYLSAISRKVLVAMVARIYEPGKKFDQVLILEGSQGIGKSTSIRALASDKWFSDAHINISDKDAVLSMRAVWLVELGELSGMRKADVDQLKEFISRTNDRIRVPYGRRTESFPRQCVFIGTTNSSEYLKDITGNRRFWPVTVGVCDFDGIRAIRDQLFAEARFAYELGEPLYLEEKTAAVIAVKEQEQRTFVDSWAEIIGTFLEGKPENFDTNLFSIHDLFESGPLQTAREDRANQMRAAEALRVLGYGRKRETAGTRRWVFSKSVLPRPT